MSQTAPCPMVYGREAQEITGKQVKTLVLLSRQGRFPKPIKIGNRNAWPRPVLLAFLGLAPALTQAAG
jgi:predicted DNA-binding transcriptional regulator AlpA